MSGSSPSSHSARAHLLPMESAQAEAEPMLTNQPRTTHYQFIILGFTTTLAVAALRARVEVEVAIEQLEEPIGVLHKILIQFFCVDLLRAEEATKSIERMGLNPIIRWCTPAEQRRVPKDTPVSPVSCIVQVAVNRGDKFATLFNGERHFIKDAWKFNVSKV